jgi:hypothetical protein
MEERLAVLEARLARAERRERLTRWAGVLAAVAALLCWGARPAGTQNQANSVRAPFQVVDANDRPLLVVDSGAMGGRLRLYGGPDLVTASIYNDQDGANLSIRNRQGRDVAVLAGPSGGILDLRDTGGKQVAALFAGVDGGNLLIRDRSGRDVAVMLATPAGDGKLALYDRSRKAIFEKP